MAYGSLKDISQVTINCELLAINHKLYIKNPIFGPSKITHEMSHKILSYHTKCDKNFMANNMWPRK